jgi:hypothetical protein
MVVRSSERQRRELHYQRKLEDKNKGNRGSDGKQRLREADGEYFVGHVRSPLID